MYIYIYVFIFSHICSFLIKLKKQNRKIDNKENEIVIKDFATPPFYGVSQVTRSPHRRLTARVARRSEHSHLRRPDLVHLR
jgi:hypothetical protein